VVKAHFQLHRFGLDLVGLAWIWLDWVGLRPVSVLAARARITHHGFPQSPIANAMVGLGWISLDLAVGLREGQR
jgi:ammonia channel protein AmtB